MARTDDYAILLGINIYPGLRNLDGPENDIDAFAAWLMDPLGGDVAPDNIKTILSRDFKPIPSEPNDANPTDRAFIGALDKWLRDGTRNWREYVGRRLYLYMAGHGFTAGSSLSDPALFSAIAQSGNTAHIAGYRYASKIADAGFFDEIILIMDCCQDVLKASLVIEPTWSPPGRNKAAHVKLFQAYGAPRGQAAFERQEVPGGPMRGYFSTVLIDALKTASADASGYVTGQTLKNQFLQLWGDRFKSITGYDPPIRVPDGSDIELFKRGQAVAGNLQPVVFVVNPPVPANSTLDIVSGNGTQSLIKVPVANLQQQILAPGLYKATVSATTRSALFEVTGAAQITVTL